MDIITLISTLVEELFQAEQKFYEQPGKMSAFEEAVSNASHRMAADYIKLTLEGMDEMFRKSVKRKQSYNIHRKDCRTLITTLGDVTFERTLFQERDTKKYRYILDDVIGLPDRERFSSLAEAKVLSEAEVHSYQHAADSLKINGQSISKVAVMEKVHGITEELPPEKKLPEDEKKCCEYLYIEADEDHIHRQKSEEVTGGMIGKLVYLFEGKQDVCEGRRILIHPHYHGGLYPGSDGNRILWETVQKYIEDHYQEDALKRVYINSDGGSWIKAGKEYVRKSVLVADRFHLMKHINRVSRLMLDDADVAKGRFYQYIHKNKPEEIQGLLDEIKASSGSEEKVEEIRTYFVNNWDAIQRAFHDKKVLGCSAEGHVSSVYSERMSSRPMGWSETGSDRMCRLRCYVRNYGREKLLDLVEYRRAQKCGEQRATGTYDYIEQRPQKHYTEKKRQIMQNAEKLQATIGGVTVKKMISIREQLGLL